MPAPDFVTVPVPLSEGEAGEGWLAWAAWQAWGRWPGLRRAAQAARRWLAASAWVRAVLWHAPDTALALAAISFLHGRGCLGPAPLPGPLRPLILACGLEQDWPMFGQVAEQEQWVYGAATLADGRVVDLLRQGRPLERERPAGGFASLGTHRWHKLFWVMPREECRVFAPPTAAALARDWDTALYLQDRLIRLHKALFLDASPAPTKFAMAQLGLCSDEVRLPISPCAEAVKPAILEAMREAGVI
jgi:hypothetical protein